MSPTTRLPVIGTGVSGPNGAARARVEWPTDEFSDTDLVTGFEVAPRSRPNGERGVELCFGLQADKLGRDEAKTIAVE